ncbi:thiamine phosphate synthase [Helicobacter sp. MIT 21-1697]|uniref:thiamine phosphate synthase n=1 Tax=Helicobacter sp. MIT 21-1697 TaxID=2993733 RepID=UPI00224B7AB6|nr:thiamine phosphate synthase [Helicobacter sp. MIT 21-1697]MCX2717507.1 thiamine phosphate synthase [Helicobacter sp. MIT 21-1697]
MKNTDFITLLITPHMNGAYLENLALKVQSLSVDWIMYRHQNSEWVQSFIDALSPLHKPLLLNLPFKNIEEILHLSKSFAGVHLKSAYLSWITPLRQSYVDEKKIIGYSAHSVDEVKYALACGADYCTLSPIFSTPNKGTPLGMGIFHQIPHFLRSRIIALGGINHHHIPILRELGLLGFAGIRCFEVSNENHFGVVD